MQISPQDNKQVFDDEGQWKVDFAFFDGKYQDQGYALISIDQSTDSFTINQDNATLHLNQVVLKVESGYDYEESSSSDCLTDMTISFIDLKNSRPFTEFDSTNTNIESIGVWVAFQSSNCSISVSSVTLKTSDVNLQELLIYILTMALSAVVGMFATNKLLENFPENITKLAKMSLWSIWLINAWDFYLFLYHVALSVALSGYLILLALLFFSLSIMSQTRLVYATYVSGYYSSTDRNVVAGCKFFALYYGLLYLLVFSYTFLTSFIWIILTSSLFLAPQIVHVYQRSRKYKFNYWHVLGLSATKIAYVLYIKLYPNNIFRLSPNLKFTSIYFGLILLQIIILFVQKFTPKFCFTPKPYSYFVKITNSEEKEEMCPICMEALKDQVISSLSKSLLQNDSQKPVVVMETPCKHRYHEECLSAWMNSKLECPSCRTAIPPLNNEDLS